MPEKQAVTVWEGDLRTGRGQVSSPSGALQQVPMAYPTRFEDAPGSSPEELLAGAHATCYSMALAGVLAKAGHPPKQLTTRATVAIEPQRGGWKITRSHLMVQGVVPGLDEETFRRLATEADQGCPVSNALRGNLEITYDATLVSEAMPAMG